MSKRNSRKRKYVRGSKKRWKGEMKTYLVIVVMCLLIAAAVSFFQAKAPEMVKKVVAKKLVEQAKELGIEGMEDMKGMEGDPADMLKKYREMMK
jgi:hypothetical protein